MLTNAAHLRGLYDPSDRRYAGDRRFRFTSDDQTWAIRYLTVDTDWLGDRKVLISPFSFIGMDWPARRLDVAADEKTSGKQPQH